MSRIEDLASRDGWVCWLCEGAIDPEAPVGSPHRATVDHVIPRSRGGETVSENLRLAHRRCNGHRGHELPERFAAIDAAPLWQTLARILRRGHPEIVAVLPTRELADEAAHWVRLRVERFVGGEWQAEVEPAGPGEACVVRLEVRSEPDIGDVGRPVVADRRRGRGPGRR